MPNETFDRDMALPDATHPVRLFHFGPAHTEGDAVVYLERQKILAVGDLLEDALPWVDDILPSHGGVYRNTDLLERQQRFFRYIVDAVRAGYDRGESVEALKANIHAADVPKPLEEGHRALRSGWDEYVATAIGHTYRELSGRD